VTTRRPLPADLQHALEPDARLEAMLGAGVFEAIDVELAYGLTGIAPSADDDTVRLAIALTSRALRDGHTCLVLSEVTPHESGVTADRPWPSAAQLLAAVHASPLRSPAPGDGAAALVLHADRLYLQRFDAFEARLASAVQARLARAPFPHDAHDIARLAQLFPDAAEDRAQHDAAALALRSSLAIITGGPGTGKTTTVLRLLAALLAREAPDTLPEILLLAPTGKAASRLTESVRHGLAALPGELLDDARRRAIPAQADTIHRALGVHPDHPYRPRHHAGHPLPADVVIVDETSMVDLPLMARLFDAVRDDARLVLLGDADQLASVDAGAVLRDLVEAPALASCVATLRRSRRFSPESALGALVFALRGDDWPAVEAALDGVTFLPDDGRSVPPVVLDAVRTHAARLASAASPEEALAELGRWRLLTALRRGPTGAEAINAQLVAERGEELAVGTPVLVIENAPDDRLANGDLGVVWEEPDGRRVVLFPGEDGPRLVGVRRLPRWEAAFAMTVHKAQGSEFDMVHVLLPPPPSPLLTRELVYTAVSRARHGVTLVASRAAVAAAHAARVRRATGLRERLSVTAAASG
jgi:exodeoxyribonuclease V alpha subunit